MNLSIEEAPARPRPNMSDIVVLLLLLAGFLASWVYVFMHPSPEAFIAVVTSQGTFVGAYHMISVHDDKVPDRNVGP